MFLNPLIKINKICSSSYVSISLPLDKKTYKVKKIAFLNLVDIFSEGMTRETLSAELGAKCNTPADKTNHFIDELIDKKILVDSLAEYPVSQIEHWNKRNWLNALIYHLESQNVECEDDQSANLEDRKRYPEAIPSSDIWQEYNDTVKYMLPEPDESILETVSFEETLLTRNSFGKFNNEPINLSHFSTIMANANALLLSNRLELEVDMKRFYCSGFTALETYVLVFNLESIPPGIYHYHPRKNELALLKEGNYRGHATEMCIGQRRAAMGGCLFLITANVKKYMDRYKHERAYRNLLINTAEFAQQYIFYATALDYSTFLTPAIKDDYAAELLNLEMQLEIPLYTVAIG